MNRSPPFVVRTSQAIVANHSRLRACLTAAALLAGVNGAVHAGEAPPTTSVDQPGGRPAPSTDLTRLDDRRPGLPGEFIIRTYLKNTPLSARDAPNVDPDAVTTAASSGAPAASERFKLNSSPLGYTTIQTRGGRYLTATGGITSGKGDPRLALQAYATTDVGTSHFRFLMSRRPRPGHTNVQTKWPGYFVIQTASPYYLTALGGGGQSTAAFHTDATKADAWERYWVLKCGDLGSGYGYAIRPAGTVRLDNRTRSGCWRLSTSSAPCMPALASMRRTSDSSGKATGPMRSRSPTPTRSVT